MKPVRPILIVLAGAVAQVASAGPLAIAPTTVEVADGRRSAVIEVENEDDRPVDLQFRAYAWDQPGGTDRLTATDDVIVSPAIVTVAPHAKQLFRVLRTTQASAAGERAYRLQLNQIPKIGDGGVTINFAFLLPLFTESGKAQPHLSWTLDHGMVRITNDGGRRVKLQKLVMNRANDAPVELPISGSSYLLKGSSRAWPLPSTGGVAMSLVVFTDAGPLSVSPATLVARR